MAVEERETQFTQKIDVDITNKVEIFRVPAHNDINGADFYHDFEMVSVDIVTLDI